MASKATMKAVMKKAASLRKSGHTPREALKLAWKSVGHKKRR